MVQARTTQVPRLAELDALRGFALGGIFLVNIAVMAGIDPDSGGLALGLVEAVFHNKFYVLFAFLFGYSLTMQFRSAERDGGSARLRTLRRCLALMVIGVLHAVFFFNGDVLFGYGAIGLILLLLSPLRPRAALWLAGFLFAIGAAALTVLSLLESGDNLGPDSDPARVERGVAALRAGWGVAASWRWENFSGGVLLYLAYGTVNILPLFLLGLAAGKSRVLEDPARYLPVLPRIQWIGFGVGAPVSILVACTHWLPLMGPLTLTAPLLTAAYAATLLRIMHAHPAVTAIFAPAGKIAATTYLGQSVLTSIIFTGYGFALAGRVSVWTALAIALVLYLLELAAARRWVRHHRYGPVEWLLRVITYGPSHFRRPPATVNP
ncbi:DUF418 domain-containing protein [Nocardia sp. 2]|uniref:DUF418 domain-containing protein n=1 Tax=Nocardia acididurans TaxID=2802282 RepID=A0ABS1LZ48_9NOCA|nr:DUF418 domain-containing protein [Nocardia acididurans]MBL1073692.1 DUF418 domain-containing protein [Nocardia acididurans]